MSTKYHPKFKTVIDRKGWRFRVRIPLRECAACQPKCAACGWPFTLSTALDYESIFCSEACRKRGIEF